MSHKVQPIASRSLIQMACTGVAHMHSQEIFVMFCLPVSDAVAKLLNTCARTCEISCTALNRSEFVNCNMQIFGGSKEKQPSSMLITHSSSPLSARFWGDDCRHRHRYHNHSHHSSDHPQDIQQVGPHSCLTGQFKNSECHEP